MQLVRDGRTVVAAVRDAQRARAAFQELGLQEGAAGQAGQARVLAAAALPAMAKSSLQGICMA